VVFLVNESILGFEIIIIQVLNIFHQKVQK